MRYRDTVTIVRAPAVTIDAVTGNETRDWSTATRTTVPGDVQPMSSDENDRDRQTTITRSKLYCDVVEMSAADRVEWEGNTYEVDGEVGLWKRRGRPHHLEAVLHRVRD